jgi:hypothetical protein
MNSVTTILAIAPFLPFALIRLGAVSRPYTNGGRRDRQRTRLLAASGTSDIADAHVVICARRSEQHIVTSDPGDLRVLDPTVQLIAL